MPAKKPHVLMVTPFLPAPPIDGGKKRVHTAMRLLADRVDFSLLSFVRNEEEMWGAASMKSFCRSVVTVPMETTPPPPGEDFRLPEIAKSCRSDKMAAALQAMIQSEPPDVVHFEFLQMAQYRRWVRGAPVVFTEHDISNISFFRSYFREMTGWRRWGRIVEWMRLVKYQIDACRGLDGVVTLTPHDTEKLHSFLPDLPIRCIYTGVDLAHFRLRPGALRPPRGAEANLVYVGHYPHYPNEDAILYFHREIFPRIVKKCPIARLWVVGSGPTPAVKALEADPRVRVTGAVKDVEPYLRKADVFVAPLRLGEGIKGKILEAFAVGVPVVTTRTGAWGLEAKDGKEFLVGRSPEDFAEKTARLLFDAKLRERLVRNGRALVERSYDWRRLADALFDFYKDVIRDYRLRQKP